MRSTRDRVIDYVLCMHGCIHFQEEVQRIRKEMRSVDFNEDSEEAIQMVSVALARLSEMSGMSNYVHNLKVAVELEFTPLHNFGLLASLFAFCSTHAGEKREKKVIEEKPNSEWVGEVGERITVPIATYRCLTSWDTMYGTTYLYKFMDDSGNVFIWKTSAVLPDQPDSEGNGNAPQKTLKGSVKGHEEYNGVKQTELTRCKIA